MAIQSVKGQPNTVYVIKGQNNPQNMAQYWSNLVSQQKYKLVSDAIKIATAEEQSAVKTDLERQKLYEKQRQELEKQKTSLNKALDALIVKEAGLVQKGEIAQAPKVSERTTEAYETQSFSSTQGSTGSGGRAGQRTPESQQQLAETKEYRKLLAERAEREKEKSEHLANMELFKTNPALQKREKEAAEKTQARITQIDDIIAPETEFDLNTGQAVRKSIDLNNDGVIGPGETGKILPAGSFERTGGTEGTEAGGPRKTATTTRRPEVKSQTTTQLEGDITPVDLSPREKELRDELASIDEKLKALKAPELQERPTILARTAEIAGRTDVGTPRRPSMDRGQMADYERQMMEKYFPQSPSAPQKLNFEPISMDEGEMPLDLGVVPPNPKAQIPLAPTAGDFTGDLSSPMDPAAPPSAMQNRMLNRSGEFPPLQAMQQNQALQTMQQPDLDPSIYPDQQSQIQQMGESLPQNQQSSELEMFNQLIGGGPQEPPMTQKQKNKMQQAEGLEKAIEAGTQKTRQDVRKQISLEEQSDWAKVVMQLYSPTSESTAMERTRLRDNAYQQIYKTYEDDKETLQKATELLISLDALEMGALPSE